MAVADGHRLAAADVFRPARGFVDEAAAWTGLGEGKLTASKIGKRRIIHTDLIKRLLAETVIPPKPAPDEEAAKPVPVNNGPERATQPARQRQRALTPEEKTAARTEVTRRLKEAMKLQGRKRRRRTSPSA
jgi:hypothetical protein